MSNIFRAYDVRGIFDKNLNPEIMLNIGIALGRFMKEKNMKNIVVGNDIRGSSVILSEALMSGLDSQDIKVTYVNTCPIGVCLFTGKELNTQIVAYVTASHLPPEWNGVKFYHGDGVSFTEKENKQIENIFKSLNVYLRPKNIINVRKIDYTNIYSDYLSQSFEIIKELKVVVDCGGGSMSLVAPQTLKSAGLNVIPLYCRVNPLLNFRSVEPTKENLKILIKEVKRNNAHFGVAFDCDGDRVVIVDDKGRVLSASQTGAILGKYTPRGNIIANIECSALLEKYLEPEGFKIIRVPVGRSFVTTESKKKEVVLGVEYSGHFVYPEIFDFDDGLIVPLKLAEILSKVDIKLSNLVDELPVYYEKRVNIKCSDNKKFKVIDNLKEKLSKNYEVNDMDGIRISMKNIRILIRTSNTEPKIRLTVESDSEENTEKVLNKFLKIIGKEINQ